MARDRSPPTAALISGSAAASAHQRPAALWQWWQAVGGARKMCSHGTLAVSVLSAVSCCAGYTAKPAPWKPAAAPLLTRWAQDVHAAQVPPHPRPMLRRTGGWQHLNGLWELDLNASDLSQPPPAGTPLPEQILVPYPVESALSGVRKLPPQFRMWYRRSFASLPCSGGTTLLHFEAVDTIATVWLNGEFIGNHTGGYDDFYFDVSGSLNRGRAVEHELVVGVYDPTTGVKGKQRRSAMTDPQGITYTSTSGIWGTVWLECVPSPAFVEALVPVPLADRSGFDLEVHLAGTVTGMAVEATLHGSGLARGCGEIQRHALATGTRTVIELQLAPPCRRLWTPQEPYLYNITVSLHDQEMKLLETVTSYAGLRTYTVGDDGTGVVRPLLNGRFVYQMATLDQGFWPDGIYTAPTDAALRFDLEAHKQMGFNAVRKHQKVESRRWYYWADVLGLMVWQDMPCCADETFPMQLANIVKKRRMHPSIVQWETFNEGGGMSSAKFVGDMVRLVNDVDPSRPVDAASGGRDLCTGVGHPIKWQSCGMFGNFTDVHHYPQPAAPGMSSGPKIAVMAAGGFPSNGSANGTTGTLIRHCDSVCYAHRIDGQRTADGAFILAPALNGAPGPDSFSLMSTNIDDAYLGLSTEAGSSRLVLMGGSSHPFAGDRNAGSFKRIPPLSGVSSNTSHVFSVVSLAATRPLYLTQYCGNKQTVPCSGCHAPHGSMPGPTHKYGECIGDYVGFRPKEQITDPRLAVWSFLPLAPVAPPPNNFTARVNGEYGGIALDPGSLTKPRKEWAPGKCRGYKSAATPSYLTSTFVNYSVKIAQLCQDHGLSASVWTQITDCETECNGLLTYDRIMKSDHPATIKAANEALTLHGCDKQL